MAIYWTRTIRKFLIYIVENNILLQKYQLNIELFTMGILCVKDLVNKRFEVLNNILSENLLFPKHIQQVNILI